MDKKKVHINVANDKGYPEPDVPVQEAWESMQQLLVQTPAATVAASGFKNWLRKGWGKIMIGTAIAATVSLIAYVVINKETVKRDSLPATDTVHNSAPVPDTLMPAAKEKRISFEFSNTPFKQVAAYMEKEFGIQIMLKGNIGNCNITTRFDNNSLKEMLDVMAYTLAFEYIIDEDKKQVTISGNGCN
ncbi:MULTISPECIES: DUF4974 domain-containing protein [Niastella]|uniref:DUF4974 domain-containing protein n=1 Tax=Niastella soli TaxID=2821487 RepID=A0ABS3YYI7_9BACT|nr:DUF4974 domain-containing protein [Niastella soli]MBO9202986.1 DUF4974 domain-containing protein [Niastella soli]